MIIYVCVFVWGAVVGSWLTEHFVALPAIKVAEDAIDMLKERNT